MRVLIVTTNFPPDLGGAASYSWELYNRLPPQSQVEIISFALLTKSSSQAIHLVSTSGTMLERQLRLFIACIKFGLRNDIFYLQDPAVVGLSGMLAAKILGKKVLTKYLGDPVWEERQRKMETKLSLPEFMNSKYAWKDWRSHAAKIVLHLSNKIIVPAVYLEETLEKDYQIPKSEVEILYNSVDIPTGVMTKGHYSWSENISKLNAIFEGLVKK